MIFLNNAGVMSDLLQDDDTSSHTFKITQKGIDFSKVYDTLELVINLEDESYIKVNANK
jgi:hypothetical protein